MKEPSQQIGKAENYILGFGSFFRVSFCSVFIKENRKYFSFIELILIKIN